MLRDRLIDTAIKFGADAQLRDLRATFHPVYRRQRAEETLTVPTETLDHSLPAGYVPTFIKVDVEGAERQVFEGAIDTISRYKPVIVFEHGKGGAPHFGTQPRHIYQLLHDEAGLDIFDMDGNGPYTLSQLEDSFELDERWDYVARPN
jgi:Methyltransferase FkbM domain